MNKPPIARSVPRPPKPSAAPGYKPPEPLRGSPSALRTAAPAKLEPDPPTAPPAFELVESELRRVLAFPTLSRPQLLARSLEALRRLWPPAPPAPAEEPAETAPEHVES